MNTFIIFIVSGFWHGASWSFIVWGFIHACGFLPLLLSNRNRTHVAHVVAYDRKKPTLKELGQMIATFAFVAFAWIFFRAKDISTAWSYVKRIVTGAWNDPGQFLKIPVDFKVFFYAGILLLLEWTFRRDERLPGFRYPFFKYAFYLSAGVLVFLYFGKKENFIYFQF